MARDNKDLLQRLLEQDDTQQVQPVTGSQRKQRDSNEAIIIIVGMLFMVVLGVYGLRVRLNYERVNMLLTSEGAFTQGVLLELPKPPTSHGRGPSTSTIAIEYTTPDHNMDLHRYQRTYTIGWSAYDSVLQNHNGQFPQTITIQYLPRQPHVSRPVVINADRTLIDLRYDWFNNILLGIYFFIFLFGGFVAIDRALQLYHQHIYKQPTVHDTNADTRIRWGCFIWLTLLLFCVLIGMWPISDQDFVSQCWPQNSADIWYTC